MAPLEALTMDIPCNLNLVAYNRFVRSNVLLQATRQTADFQEEFRQIWF